MARGWTQDPDRSQLGVAEGVFVWAYAGNVGLAQDLETAVRAAGILGPDFRLLVVGDGPRRAEVEALAERVAPGRVDFTGLVPRPRAAELLRASDATLVSLAPSPGIAYAVPSKLYDCCAVGRPVVLAAAGEAARLAEAHEIALRVEPGDPAGLATAVRRLRAEPELGRGLAARARAFAAEHLRERQADRLVELLHSVAR